LSLDLTKEYRPEVRKLPPSPFLRRWWFGCYGDPKTLLVTDADFNMKGRHEIDCSLGIEGMTGGRLLVGNGQCEKDKGCNGTVQTAFPDEKAGFKFRGGDGH
jgi:hypothetical protein